MAAIFTTCFSGHLSPFAGRWHHGSCTFMQFQVVVAPSFQCVILHVQRDKNAPLIADHSDSYHRTGSRRLYFLLLHSALALHDVKCFGA